MHLEDANEKEDTVRMEELQSNTPAVNQRQAPEHLYPNWSVRSRHWIGFPSVELCFREEVVDQVSDQVCPEETSGLMNYRLELGSLVVLEILRSPGPGGVLKYRGTPDGLKVIEGVDYAAPQCRWNG